MVSCASSNDVKDGDWEIIFNPDNKTLTISQKGETIVTGAYATAKALDGSTVESTSYPEVNLTQAAITDEFGSGKKYTYTYSGIPDADNLEQSFYIYGNLPYMLVEASVVAADGKASITGISPIVSKTPVTTPLPASRNQIYDMPYDNDNWHTFATHEWSIGVPVTSCEATALFNVDSRKGIVMGSVDHSDWKSAVTVTPNSTNRMRALELQAGYISDRTWDTFTDGRASISSHGPVIGEVVNSPKFMIGIFDDWRTGLETYGEANTVLCPKYEWDKDDSFFGWQSWGGMEFGINYKSVMSVLDFFEKELYPVGFHNAKGRTLLVLDSGWSYLSPDELREFTRRCKELGFVPGAYSTPFSYWGSVNDAKNNVMWEGGNLGEMVLKGNGEYRHITGVSLDPTHPVVKEWNRKKFNEIRDLGFEYVKIDFMNNGAQESDSYYLPEITTGMQAYNYGLDYIKEFAGDMMLDFSIAPIFPAKAHMRRIGCDAWGELNFSMYTLNCINGSWWLDRVYAFNDPDAMCMSKVELNGKGSADEQEARIRYTSGLITGVTLLGGTYAYEGDWKVVNGKNVHVVGYDEERERAVKFASNNDLTEVGRIGRTFRPVEGTMPNNIGLWQLTVTVDNEFIYDADSAFYYVVFNYDTSKPLSFTPDFKRLGIGEGKYSEVKELWFGETTTPEELKVEIPPKDVRIYKFRGTGSGTTALGSVGADSKSPVAIAYSNGSLSVKAHGNISKVDVLDLGGRIIKTFALSGRSADVVLPVSPLSSALAIVQVLLDDSGVYSGKIVMK